MWLLLLNADCPLHLNYIDVFYLIQREEWEFWAGVHSIVNFVQKNPAVMILDEEWSNHTECSNQTTLVAFRVETLPHDEIKCM